MADALGTDSLGVNLGRQLQERNGLRFDAEQDLWRLEFQQLALLQRMPQDGHEQHGAHHVEAHPDLSARIPATMPVRICVGVADEDARPLDRIHIGRPSPEQPSPEVLLTALCHQHGPGARSAPNGQYASMPVCQYDVFSRTH